MQVVTVVPGQGGQFQSVVPLTSPPWFVFGLFCFLVEKGCSLLGLSWVPKRRFKKLLIREVRNAETKG